MHTVLIQINNDKAYKLLADLEELQIIKVLHKSPETKPKQKLSEKYAGKLPENIVEDLQNYVSESRSQWDRNNI